MKLGWLEITLAKIHKESWFLAIFRYQDGWRLTTLNWLEPVWLNPLPAFYRSHVFSILVNAGWLDMMLNKYVAYPPNSIQFDFSVAWFDLNVRITYFEILTELIEFWPFMPCNRLMLGPYFANGWMGWALSMFVHLVLFSYGSLYSTLLTTFPIFGYCEGLKLPFFIDTIRFFLSIRPRSGCDILLSQASYSETRSLLRACIKRMGALAACATIVWFGSEMVFLTRLWYI